MPAPSFECEPDVFINMLIRCLGFASNNTQVGEANDWDGKRIANS